MGTHRLAQIHTAPKAAPHATRRKVPPAGHARDMAPALHIDHAAILRAARQHGPGANIILIFLRQLFRETLVRRWKGIDFRRNRNDDACNAYCAMEVYEFTTINARQAWANWRTIPRNLDQKLPGRPVRAIDLCCGTGESTAVLAHYCAPGSTILGIDYNPRFLEVARARDYLNSHGGTASVSFRAQSVLETLRDADGVPIPDNSIDLVNASGAVGCHFDSEAAAILARECQRVIRPGGLANIDTGRQGTPRDVLARIFARHGFTVVGQARSCFLDRYTQLSLRKDAASGDMFKAPSPARLRVP